MRRRIIMGGLVTLLILVINQSGVCGQKAKVTDEGVRDQQREKVGDVAFVMGEVQVKTAQRSWVKAKLGMDLDRGDIIKTQEKSQVEIKLKGGEVIKISENTTIRVGKLVGKREEASHSVWMSQLKSKMARLVRKGSAHEPGGINIVAGVRGAERRAERGRATHSFMWAGDEQEPRDKFSQSVELFNDERFQEVIDGLLAYIKENPRDSKVGEAYLLLGNSYFELADYTQAAQSYENATRKSPSSDLLEEVNFMKGLSYSYAERHGDSIKIFKRYIKDFPEGKWLVNVYFMMGSDYDELGMSDKAIKSYQKVVEKFPEDRFIAGAAEREISRLKVR